MSAKDIVAQHLGHPNAIVDGAAKEDLGLALACALVEQESGGRNIFGHDAGGFFPGEAVTKAKVQELLRHVHAGGTSNGVGLTQLTWVGYLDEAEKAGGLHLPKFQCIVGFRALKQIIGQYGEGGAWRYNGSPSYQAELESKYATWRSRLN